MARILPTVEICLCQLNTVRFLTPNFCTKGNESFFENEPFLSRYSDISSLENTTHQNLCRTEKQSHFIISCPKLYETTDLFLPERPPQTQIKASLWATSNIKELSKKRVLELMTRNKYIKAAKSLIFLFSYYLVRKPQVVSP